MNDNKYKNVTRTITVLLEDITDATAQEFFERLNGHEIELKLGDGLDYVATVESVD